MNVRTKGHNAERYFANQLKDWYPFCMTTRQTSTLLDSCGIDLDNVPFNIQIKSGYPKGLNYRKEIDYVLQNIIAKPYIHERLNLPTLLIHRHDVGKGKRRGKLDDMVIMPFEDFMNILKQVNDNKSKSGVD